MKTQKDFENELYYLLDELDLTIVCFFGAKITTFDGFFIVEKTGKEPKKYKRLTSALKYAHK